LYQRGSDLINDRFRLEFDDTSKYRKNISGIMVFYDKRANDQIYLKYNNKTIRFTFNVGDNISKICDIYILTENMIYRLKQKGVQNIGVEYQAVRARKRAGGTFIVTRHPQ
jgi:hypothetical protein